MTELVEESIIVKSTESFGSVLFSLFEPDLFGWFVGLVRRFYRQCRYGHVYVVDFFPYIFGKVVYGLEILFVIPLQQFQLGQ